MGRRGRSTFIILPLLMIYDVGIYLVTIEIIKITQNYTFWVLRLNQRRPFLAHECKFDYDHFFKVLFFQSDTCYSRGWSRTDLNRRLGLIQAILTQARNQVLPSKTRLKMLSVQVVSEFMSLHNQLKELPELIQTVVKVWPMLFEVRYLQERVLIYGRNIIRSEG